MALRHFANRGYAGTSVQDIVDEAKVAKPTLYYYFKNKAALYQALIDYAHDERYALMSSALAVQTGISNKLAALLKSVFSFITNHRELVRLSFSTAFAAPGEVPAELCYKEKCQRNFQLIEGIMRQAQKDRELTCDFDPRELTMAWYGLMNIYVMGQIFQPEIALDQRTAKRIVDLFLRGAAAHKKG